MPTVKALQLRGTSASRLKKQLCKAMNTSANCDASVFLSHFGKPPDQPRLFLGAFSFAFSRLINEMPRLLGKKPSTTVQPLPCASCQR